MSSRCIEDTGRELSNNNVDIVKYLCSIEEERATLEDIIQKQYQERKRIEMEIEKLTYKLCLINKSLSMRIKAKNNYDKTIEEIRTHYTQLVLNSNRLRQMVEKTQAELDDIMNKKTGTAAAGEDGRNRLTDMEECPCANEEPTKEIKEKISVQSQKNELISVPSPVDSIGETSIVENICRTSDPSGTELQTSTSQNESEKAMDTTQSIEKTNSKPTKEETTTNTNSQDSKENKRQTSKEETAMPNKNSQDSNENRKLTFSSERVSKGLTVSKLKELKGLKQSLATDALSTERQGSSTIREKDLRSK